MDSKAHRAKLRLLRDEVERLADNEFLVLLQNSDIIEQVLGGDGARAYSRELFASALTELQDEVLEGIKSARRLALGNVGKIKHAGREGLGLAENQS